MRRHQQIHRQRAKAEIDDADQDLQQRQPRRRQHHLPAVLAEFAAVFAERQPAEIGDDGGDAADRDQAVDCRRQLIHRGCGRRMPGHADAEHEGVAEPECQSGQEADLGNVDRVQSVVRIDPEADRAAGEDGRADVVADGIAGEAGERRDPVGHVLLADRSQREEIIECQREECAR